MSVTKFTVAVALLFATSSAVADGPALPGSIPPAPPAEGTPPPAYHQPRSVHTPAPYVAPRAACTNEGACENVCETPRKPCFTDRLKNGWRRAVEWDRRKNRWVKDNIWEPLCEAERRKNRFLKERVWEPLCEAERCKNAWLRRQVSNLRDKFRRKPSCGNESCAPTCAAPPNCAAPRGCNR